MLGYFFTPFLLVFISLKKLVNTGIYDTNTILRWGLWRKKKKVPFIAAFQAHKRSIWVSKTQNLGGEYNIYFVKVFSYFSEPLSWILQYSKFKKEQNKKKLLPLFTGGSLNVHALWSWQTLGLCLKAVGGRAGEGAHTLAALTTIGHTCKGKIQLFHFQHFS